jgi:hypothetical protein
MLKIARNQLTKTSQFEVRIFVALKVHEISKPEFSRLRLRSEPSVAQRLLSARLEQSGGPVIAENHQPWFLERHAVSWWFLHRLPKLRA